MEEIKFSDRDSDMKVLSYDKVTTSLSSLTDENHVFKFFWFGLFGCLFRTVTNTSGIGIELSLEIRLDGVVSQQGRQC